MKATLLVLASGSPRRADLLRQLGLPFRIVVSAVPELSVLSRHLAPHEICLGNAREQTVEAIWEGPVLTRMRRAFWNDLQAVEPRCVRCPIRHWDIEKLYRTHRLA